MKEEIPQQNCIKVALVIPVFNCEKYILELLNSIRNQTYRNFIVILVDDCSTDNSLNICQNFAKNDSRIITIAQKANHGVSATRNKALDYLSYYQDKPKYICFIDSDDVLSENYIQKLVSEAEINHADYVVCGNVDFSKNKKFYDLRYKCNDMILDKDQVFQQFFAYGDFAEENGKKSNSDSRYLSNRLFKYDLISNIRFNTSLRVGEDGLFFVECLNNISKGVQIHDVLYFYRLRKSSTTNTNITYYKTECFIKVKNELMNMTYFNKLSDASKIFMYKDLADLYFYLGKSSFEQKPFKENFYQINKQQIKTLIKMPYITGKQRKRLKRILLGYLFNFIYFKFIKTSKLEMQDKTDYFE